MSPAQVGSLAPALPKGRQERRRTGGITKTAVETDILLEIRDLLMEITGEGCPAASI